MNRATPHELLICANSSLRLCMNHLLVLRVAVGCVRSVMPKVWNIVMDWSFFQSYPTMLLTQSTAIPSRDVSESFTQLHRNQSARQSIFPTSMTADPTRWARNGIPARSACLINCPRSIAVGGGQTQFCEGEFAKLTLWRMMAACTRGGSSIYVLWLTCKRGETKR